MNTRTPVYEKSIDHPAAWTAATLGGKENLVYKLRPAHLSAIDELLKKTSHLAPQKVSRREWDHPVLNGVLAELRDIILNGLGTVIIRGITRERYSAEQFERIYWGFGTHWGDATVQSYTGARLAHVREEKNNPHARGYLTNNELQPHTDSFEIVGLMCVNRAETGGFSRMVSTLAIHNEMLRTRPDLLAPLYRGVPHAVLEAKGTEDAVTKFNVPVFSCVDGQVSCLFSRMFIMAAVDQSGVKLPEEFAEAMTYFEQLIQDERFRVQFMLEPGEMMVWNNFVILHSRTRFEDSERNTRDLLRLWLNVEQGRHVVPELYTWARIYEKLAARRMAEHAKA
jgi:hypothetical protein